MNAVDTASRPVPARVALLLALLVAVPGLGRTAVAQPASAGTPGCEARAAAAHEVLPAGSLDNWEPLSERAVLIWTQHSDRAYLVRVDRELHDLAAAPVIDLVDGDHDRTLSPCGYDGVMVGGGRGDGTIARIVSIERLSARRTVELDPGAPKALPDSWRV